ncbi:hypothetical protein PBRA_009014 [Plasmodiophora brassicae]|uniref:Uncharacterized protein n=1 Tax=Plasmodiophora brassicae TaxID=37360 RepID=A0A0G4J4C0_PLABS|nr:hypothetical protein PBRA_009014 [Plasmodiophora brassicae]
MFIGNRGRLVALASFVIVSALSGGRVGMLTLRSGDGAVHIVPISRAIAHSGLLSDLVDCVGDNAGNVSLSNIARAELEAVVDFINTTAVADVNRAAQIWVRERLRTTSLEGQCRLLIAADFLDMRPLMTAIVSSKRAWGDIASMRDELPSDLDVFVVDNAPGIVRVGQVAKTDEQKAIVNRVRDVLVGGGNGTFLNVERWVPMCGLLCWSAMRGEELIVDLLVNVPGIDVNIRDTLGHRTPLNWAATRRHYNVVELLLKVPGIVVNAVDNYQRTALHSAVSSLCERSVELLLQAPDVDVNACEMGQWTALHRASEWGQIRIVQLLLAAPGINVNARTVFGMTPLHKAACAGRRRVVELLLDAPGVIVDAVGISQMEALQCGSHFGHDDVLQLLQNASTRDAQNAQLSPVPSWLRSLFKCNLRSWYRQLHW